MSKRSDLVAALDGVGLFSSCSKRDRAIVARHMQLVALPAGGHIIDEGDVGDAFYVLLEGEATVSRRGAVLDHAKAGECFGELALLDSGPRRATVVADTDVTLGVLGARILAVLLMEMPALSVKLLKALAQRIRETDIRHGD